MEFPIGMFVGMIVGIFVSAILWGFVAIPVQTDSQFKKDCVAMAHGSVDKSAKNICAKNGKILFHK
jgi:hypothetical protein